MVATPALFTAGQSITAAFLQSLQPQPWTALTLLNSWANQGPGFVNAQYRLANAVTVEIVGVIKNGTITNGTPIATLPAGYTPGGETDLPLQIRSPAVTSSGALLTVQTSGSITVQGIPAGTTVIGFAARFPIDA